MSGCSEFFIFFFFFFGFFFNYENIQIPLSTIQRIGHVFQMTVIGAWKAHSGRLNGRQDDMTEG